MYLQMIKSNIFKNIFTLFLIKNKYATKLQKENGKEKGVYAKMARGAMVRYLAENQIENIKDITQFSDLGYTFDASQSTEKNYIFKKKLSS